MHNVPAEDDGKSYDCACPEHAGDAVQKAWCELKTFWLEYIQFLQSPKAELELSEEFTYDDLVTALEAKPKLATAQLLGLQGSLRGLKGKKGEEARHSKKKSLERIKDYLRYVVHPQDLNWLTYVDSNTGDPRLSREALLDMALWLYGLQDGKKPDSRGGAVDRALRPALPVPFLGSPVGARIVAVANNPGQDDHSRDGFEATQSKNLKRLTFAPDPNGNDDEFQALVPWSMQPASGKPEDLRWDYYHGFFIKGRGTGSAKGDEAKEKVRQNKLPTFFKESHKPDWEPKQLLSRLCRDNYKAYAESAFWVDVIPYPSKDGGADFMKRLYVLAKKANSVPPRGQKSGEIMPSARYSLRLLEALAGSDQSILIFRKPQWHKVLVNTVAAEDRDSLFVTTSAASFPITVGGATREGQVTGKDRMRLTAKEWDDILEQISESDKGALNSL